MLGNAETILGNEGPGRAFSELTFGSVDVCRIETTGSNTNTTDRLEVSVVDGVGGTELSIGVAPVRLLVTEKGQMFSGADGDWEKMKRSGK